MVIIVFISASVVAFSFQVVKDDTEVIKFFAGIYLVDQFQNILRGIVLTNEEKGGVGQASQDQGVGNNTKGRGVEDDDIVFLTGRLQEVMHLLCFQQLGRIGRNGAGRGNKEIGDIGGANDVFKFCFVNQIGTYPGVVIQIKDLVDLGLSQVEAYQQGFLAGQSEDSSQIQRDPSPAWATSPY